MESYDAIREQLKSAQARAQENLRRRLEGVLSALEGAKAEVERTATGEADDLFPVHEIEATVDELDVPSPEPPPPGVTLELLRGLDAARSQSDLLNQLMTSLTDHASRAAVLVIRGQSVSAWSGVGFGEDTDLQSWKGETATSRALDRLAADAVPIRFSPVSDSLLGEWLAGDEPATEALLVPVSLRGKVMGAVYADWTGSGPWDPDMVQALVAVSCWLIDTLHHRTAPPTPMVAVPLDLTAAAAIPAPPMAEPEPVQGLELDEEPETEGVPEPPVAEEEEEFAVAGAEPVAAVEEEPAAAAEPEVEVGAEAEEVEEELEYTEELEFSGEPELPESAVVPEAPELEVAATAEIGDAEFDPSATVQVDLGEVEVSPPEEGSGIGLDTMSEVTEAEPAPEASWQPPAAEEPPPVRPVTPPPELAAPEEEAAGEAGSHLSPEEETRHEEARRFARLLVSEIKLYNERDVDKGRESRDLYQRLKEDIDRSREMYEKRIAPDVRAARDYFHEELVRILADGNPDALGM